MLVSQSIEVGNRSDTKNILMGHIIYSLFLSDFRLKAYEENDSKTFNNTTFEVLSKFTDFITVFTFRGALLN